MDTIIDYSSKLDSIIDGIEQNSDILNNILNLVTVQNEQLIILTDNLYILTFLLVISCGLLIGIMLMK